MFHAEGYFPQTYSSSLCPLANLSHLALPQALVTIPLLSLSRKFDALKISHISELIGCCPSLYDFAHSA